MKKMKFIPAYFLLTLLQFLYNTSIAQNIVKPTVKAPNAFEVNSFTGNLYHQRTDMKMPSQGLPLEIVFSYNNTRRANDWGMGPGWTFTYNMAYTPDSSGSIYIERADGRRDYFRKVGNNYKAPPGVFDVLTEYQSGKYKLLSKDRMSYFFDNPTHKKLTGLTDLNNNSITIAYTGLLPVSITDAANRAFTLNWQDGHLINIQNTCSSPIRTIHFAYDTASNPVSVINPAGDSVRYYYDNNSRIIGYTDENGYNMSFTYNFNGAVSKIVSCVTTQLFTYSSAIRKTFVTELVKGERQITTYSYDTTGRVIHKEGNCCGYNIAYQYDLDNNVTNQTDGNNQATQYLYDARGNIIKETDAIGKTASYTWHPTFNVVTSAINKRGFTTTYEYDTRGNLTKINRPLGVKEVFTYDAKGNTLSHTDGNNNTTTYAYNNFGQLTKTTDALNGVTQNIYNGCGNLAQLIDARNNATFFEYDALNRVIKTTNALVQSTFYTYDGYNNLLTVKDALGRITTYHYDGLGRRIATTSPLGITTNLDYDEKGNRIKQTDGKGNSTSFSYNSRNQPLTETDAAGNTKSFEYDAAGNLVSETDKKGNRTRYEYDILNRRIKIVNAEGGTSEIGYDAEGNRSSVKDFKGNTSSFDYDELNRQIKNIDPFNKTIVNTYDNNGNLVSRKDKNNSTWIVKYDALNREIKNSNPLGYFTETLYDANGNRLSVKDPLGNITRYTYDVLNRQQTETNPLNELTSYTYDSVGNPKTTAYPNGNIVTNTYDDGNRLVKTQDVIGIVARYAYDANDNRVTEQDANNNTITYGYDALNMVIKITDAMGFGALKVYDANNNTLTETDRNSNSKNYEYDKLNRLKTEIDAMGNKTRFEYDANSNRNLIIDANGNITSYSMDALNRLTRETYADGTFKAYTYDDNGNFKTRRDNNSEITNYTYDAANRMTKRSYPGGLNETFTYDSTGRRLTAINNNATVKFTYDAVGRMLSETLNGKTTGYTYSTAERKRILSYPGGRFITELSDQRARLNSITESGNIVVGFVYDPADRLLTKNMGNGVTQHYSYDANNRVTNLDCQPGNVINFQYSYDKEGNRLMALKNHRPAYSEKYQYDKLYRLTGFYNGKLTDSVLSDTTSKNIYANDPLHNRILSNEDSIARSYNSNNTNAYASVTTNGIASNFTYDANGNTTNDGMNAYHYDIENRLISIAGYQQYLYDAIGRKISTTTTGSITHKYYYANSRVIEERNTVDAVQKSFVFGNWIDDLISFSTAANTYYFSNNKQGSIYAVLKENAQVERYDYTGYGALKYYNNIYQELPNSSIDNNLGFHGRMSLNDNLIDFRTRVYQNSFGRFSQRDQLGSVDGYNLLTAYFIPNSSDPFGTAIGLDGAGIQGSIHNFNVDRSWPDLVGDIDHVKEFAKTIQESSEVQPWLKGLSASVKGNISRTRLGLDPDIHIRFNEIAEIADYTQKLDNFYYEQQSLINDFMDYRINIRQYLERTLLATGKVLPYSSKIIEFKDQTDHLVDDYMSYKIDNRELWTGMFINATNVVIPGYKDLADYLKKRAYDNAFKEAIGEVNKKMNCGEDVRP